MKRNILKKILAPLGLVVLSAALRAGDTAISDGQNAEDVLGQTDGGGVGVFTQGTPYNSVALQGFNMPYGIDIDTVSHRLFVADRSSSRIMEYDLDSSNVLVDRTADHVLGQTNFYGNLYGTTKNTLSYPNNLDFDPASNRLFVADGLSPRVLIFDVASITDGENAVNELGQTNFTAATLATTINGLNYIYDVLFDAPTNRLFVSDYGNHRVMVYNLASISDGENAVNVLGQSDFTTGTSGLTQNKLSTPQEMSFDSASNRLFVAETGNRRVVVFDVASITDGENAINVLGQTTFTTNGTAVTQKGLTAPSGLAFDDGTQRLFVSDVSANRIVVYDVASITDGENAVNVLGQTSFTASGAAVSQSGLLNPRGLALDSGNNRLYSVDYLHCRVLSFDVASITDGENADNVIGQTDGMGGGVYTTQGVYDGAAQEGFNWPYAVEVDTVSHRLFVTDNATSRVLEYDLDASNTLVDRTFDHFLGQLENTRNLPTTTAYSTYNPAGLAFDPATNRLFVANYSSSRVTVFDVASITDGENAVNVLGQATMVSATRTASQSGMNLPGGLSFEPANSRLYVGDNLNHRVLVFDVASITDGENAINVLGQSNFTTATSGTTQNTMNSPYFVNHDGGTRLFVGDRTNNRVLVFDTTSITDGENAVSVLGQTNFTTATSGTTQSKFNLNYGLVSDRTGNRLFVSDFYNHRLLVFDTASITDGENAVNVIGQSNFTTGTYATAQNRLYYPQGITYEPAMNRLYVADRYNNRVLTYSAGPVAPSTSTLAASSGVEQVTLSWNSPGDDGVFNDLTGNYRIQYATYTLSWSTSSTPTNATTVTVATTSVAPGSAQSWTLGSLDGGVTYYFVLWTQDDANNWSGISNTTSAVPSAYAWFDTTQIEIDTVNGGLQNGSVVWGDFDNDGDSDILANGSDASYQLRVYKNNGNGTFNPLQSEVDGANGGIQSGGAVAGDFDNDGDLDVLVVGANSSTSQLRVYRGNGNATFDGAQIEVDGLNGGLTSSSVAWGDYDNDGDLDILTAGSGGGYQLRVYKNNGNGTFDPNQLDLDGVGYGVYQCGTAWGDFDNDGDLDILAGGYDVNSYQLRIYKNNGNGTLNSTQIDVDGSGGGLQQCGVAWGDFDNDGDLDILGVGDNGAKQLRVYKNNGNGTIDATQIEVDGSGGGLTTASAAWGDFDNDGDLDILENGTDGTNRQLRVYKNNGTASFSPNQIEVDGLNGGLSAGGAAWGDFDIDGDLDILTSGTDGTNRQLRVYKNQSAVANTAPSAPTTLTAAWAFNASGISTATFKWNPAVDNGATATPANVLTYQVEISSSSGFTGKSVVADPHGSSPGMGNYLKPPLMFDGLTTHGVMLYSLPLTNTTFYYRVKTIDAGLKESAWSSTGSLYTAVPSSAPSAVVDLAAGQLGDGQITLQWTEPLNINSGANAQYDVRFSTTAPIANDTDFNNATSLSGEPAPGLPGTRVSMGLLNLTPMVTYYFGLKASNDNGTSALDVVTPRPSAVASPFDATQIEVDGIRGGLHQGGAAWGDFDNDGDLDVLASGYDASTRQFRVYKSNGNGTIDPVQIEVESLNNGFNLSGVAWGDFDNDGDLDILVNGDDAAGRQLRVYRNNGNGTINATQIEVESLNGGLNEGGVAWGDFDNDGDLDVLADGYDGANSQLRVYKNNGNGTLDAVQIEVDGLNNGLRVATVAWGDFDKDGDLDILTNGSTGPNQLRVYKNLGDGTIDATQIEVDGLNGGIQAGGSTWGDFDNDGDMDILIAGWDGSNSQLRVYKNNGNGTIDTAQIEVDGVNNGLRYSSVAWGDHDNDGDLDILASGNDGTNNQLRIYGNNGNGTINATQIEVDRLTGGLRNSSVAWGDYDSDMDLDFLVLGYDGYLQLRIYKNQFEAFQANTLPTAPSSFSSGFSYTSTSVSVASMTWSAGSDSGTGATPENVLTYDVQISTTSNFATLIFPGQMGATPRMGSYLKPPKIFNSNTYYGVVLKSTDPWNAQTTASYGLRTDTTYYYRVKTVDSALAESGWSSNGSAYTGVAPSTSTLAAASTATDGEVLLTWNSAGDDGMNGNVTGTYRIQYATYTPTWSTSSTPTNATTVTVATTTQVPGSAQTKLITGLTGGLTYYFVLWTGDEVPNWSTISNSTSAVPTLTVDVVSPSTSTLAATSGNPEEVVLTWSSAGDDGSTGNLTGNYRIQYATYSATWDTGSTPTNGTTVTIATTTQTPGSAQSKTITGLLSGTTYYFAIYTQDEASNWSGVSNTTSAVAGLWFDPNQIEVDGSGSGLAYGGLAWGDYDNDGDQDILACGEQVSGGSTRELRIYKNNGNGTIDSNQIEVDGAAQGLINSSVSWGDFDNDGDLDILASGLRSSTRELRVYINNGNGTISANQIEVDGAGGGLYYGTVNWGDFDNDGDLDILASGSISVGELRIYKNNGNGTFDATQIEVDSIGFGLGSGTAIWGDFDNDGDLDILASGILSASTKELRVYITNGNGTINTNQIEIDGASGGVWNSSVSWGDYDNDGDLDILASGQQSSGLTRELRVYKNNGNGTIDATQIEVAGSGNGLESGGTGWGDFDNDGDLDILASGYNGSTRELRVYKNNGNGTINPTQIDLDESGGGLRYGTVAWGDYDNDGDLDVLANGEQTSGSSRELRIYKSNASLLNSNVSPNAPSVLSADWVHNAAGVSTATFKWNPGVDNGTGATPENVLTYQLEVSTTSGFTGKSIVAGQWASPGMGNYHKPPKTFDGNTKHGVMLRNFPQTNTTYYYRVKTLDAGLKESSWSATGSVYTLVASSEPSAVVDLVAGVGEGQTLVTWTAPLNIQSGGSAYFDLRYSTVGAITDNTTFSNATQMTGEPTPGTAGTSERMALSGLMPGWTYYFGIKSTNDNGTSVLDVSNPRPSSVANYFDMTQIEVDGAGSGPYSGGVSWGDFDNDGDLDVLSSGIPPGGVRIQVHLNNGNGTFNATQLEIDGSSGGLYFGNVVWGDFDNDGDLDILASGTSSTSSRELRIYKNNGNGTVNYTQIEVESAAGGLNNGDARWGDFDNDGDLDILASGAQTSGNTRELRVYQNNGNGTLNDTQIEVDSAGGGLNYGGVAWGDFDNDGDLDILASGQQTSGITRELRVYKNNGNGTIDASQIEVDGAGGGLYYSSVVWGDFDNDGDLDVLASGQQSSGNTRELRVYKNNGNGTIDASQIEVDGAGGGLNYGGVAWGDFDNDGDLDILASGQQTSGSTRELRVYKNNGNGTIDASQIEVDGPGGGLYFSGVGWADFDTDGDLDILGNGQTNGATNELRIYKNTYSAVQSNTNPTAPTTLAGGFTFDASGVSVASLTWNTGTDSGTGATPENVLTYDIQISTVSNFSSVIFPGQMGATPRMGSYLKPPKIFNSNSDYGVVLKSTDPWNTHTTASYGLRTDTTYYYRVKTVDSVLAESGWSSGGSAYTGVSPSTSTLAAAAGTSQVSLSWNSAGDDGVLGNLTGNYRIQYATYTATWSTSSTPANATTVTLATTTQSPGSAQGYTATGLTGGLTYYFVLWSGDEVPNWSTISNTTNTVPAAPVTVTLAEAVGQPGWIGQGETARILGTAQAVSNSASGVTVSSVAVRETGSYTADGNLTNVEIWVSSSGYIDASAIRLENTAKAFSSDAAVFTQNVNVSTTPLYFIARADVSGSATEGTFDLSLQVYTTALTANIPIAFTNSTDLVAPPSGAPSGLTATASGNLLRVSLSWGASAGADTYSVYRATYSGVTTTDFLLGITNATSFNDDYITPAQQMYYKVIGTNRAGASGASGSANATSVVVPALVTSNIYLRAGTPSLFGDSNPAYHESLNGPLSSFVDNDGNVYIADTSNNKIRYIPKKAGTYFGQSMTANYVYTIAGTGTGNYGGDGGVATSAQIYGPHGLCVDGAGNVYFADYFNHRMRFIPRANGTYFGQSMTANCIYTIAGTGTNSYGGDGGLSTLATLNGPFSVSLDAQGNVYIADFGNNRIRFVAKTTGTYFGQSMTANYIYTIAGDGTGAYGGDGGVATSAQLKSPTGVNVDAGGNVYILDYSNARIRFVAKTSGAYFGQPMTANNIYTIAGDGTAGFAGNGVIATSAQFGGLYGICFDASGNVYCVSRWANRIRFIPKTSGTYFGQAMTANYAYFIAGTGTGAYGGDGGAATSAQINNPSGVNVDGAGNLYISDTLNNRIRLIPKANGTFFGQAMTANYIYTIAGGGAGNFDGEGGNATSTRLNWPFGLVVDQSGNIYFSDYINNRIRFVPKMNGTYYGQSMTANCIYTVAGNGLQGASGDNGSATSAKINYPYGVTVDPNGNMYIADTANHKVRFVPSANGTYFGVSMTANYIYTIAGTGAASSGGDAGPSTAAQIDQPRGVAVDAEGNVYIAELSGNRIRFIAKSSGTYFGQVMTANYIYTIAGDGSATYGGEGGPATLAQIYYPNAVCLDPRGNVYVSVFANRRILMVPKESGTYFGQAMTANCMYKIAGTGAGSFGGDNVPATGAPVYSPSGVSVDAGGNVYIADTYNHRIRFIPARSGTYFGQPMTSSYIYSIAGTGSTNYNGENAVGTGKNLYQPMGVHAGADHMVYVTEYNNKIRMIAGEDFIAPSTSTLAASAGLDEATIRWVSAGDDNVNLGNLTGNYRIQYATYTAAWSTASTPANATTVTIATTSAAPGSAQSYVATGLTGGATYYFALFTGDEVPNWSDVSNTASAWLDGTAPSTSTLTAVTGDVDGEIDLTWSSAGDNGMSGILTGTYRIQYATYTASWSTSTTPTDATTVTISTANAVPGSAETYTASGLTIGLTYYFVLWTGDEVPNWSTISNSTSAVPFVSIRSMTIEGLSTLGFGTVNLGSQVVSSTGVVIRNDGTLLNRYSMSASTDTVGTPWNIQTSTPAGPDAMVIFGLFDGDTGPVLGNFDVDDVIGPTDNSSSSTIYSIDGSTTGTNVPAGEARKLWIRLDMPTTSRTETPQSIRIRITAEPP